MFQGNQRWWANATKEEKRERTRPGTEASQKANPSSIEKLIWKELGELGIEYETQVSFNHGKFIVDIYIPSLKIIIECNGNYWHNYKKFPERKIRDEALERYANENNYRIMWLWESEIRKDPRQALRNGLEALRKIGELKLNY